MSQAFEVSSSEHNLTEPLLPRVFCSAEHLIFSLLAASFCATLALITATGQLVRWADFIPLMAAAAGLILLAGMMRRRGNAIALSDALTGLSCLFLFGNITALFLLSLLPIRNPLIDPGLMAFDAAVGYDWSGFVEAMARWPVTAQVLRVVYASSLLQMVVLTLWLGLSGRKGNMLQFLLTGMFSMMICLAIFALWPSVGPSGWKLPPGNAATIVGVPAVHNLELVSIVTSPVSEIRLGSIKGLISFPSYHMLMALMVAWYSYGTRIFSLAAVLGLAMVPATLAHGGHHLIDLAASLVVFACCVLLSRRLVTRASTA